MTLASSVQHSPLPTNIHIILINCLQMQSGMEGNAGQFCFYGLRSHQFGPFFFSMIIQEIHTDAV